MPENKLVDLSFEFAKNIVELTDTIKTPKSSYMIDQLARAGTSVGANIHEAQYAHSKADFIAKLEIALKEANETSYWLVVFTLKVYCLVALLQKKRMPKGVRFFLQHGGSTQMAVPHFFILYKNLGEQTVNFCLNTIHTNKNGEKHCAFRRSYVLYLFVA